jgi:hypothetical protein
VASGHVQLDHYPTARQRFVLHVDDLWTADARLDPTQRTGHQYHRAAGLCAPSSRLQAVPPQPFTFYYFVFGACFESRRYLMHGALVLLLDRLVMDSFGLLSCNGKQVFTTKVVIGKGNDFKIGPMWASAYPFDSNFQMTLYREINGTQALDELDSGNVYT